MAHNLFGRVRGKEAGDQQVKMLKKRTMGLHDAEKPQIRKGVILLSVKLFLMNFVCANFIRRAGGGAARL